MVIVLMVRLESNSNEATISYTSSQPRTLEEAKVAANVSDEFEVISWQSSSWTVILKGGDSRVAFRTMLKLKRKAISSDVMAGLEELIKRLETRQATQLATSAPPITGDGHLAVIRLCDLHAGRRHYLTEEDWSLEKFNLVARNAVRDLVELCRKHIIEKIMIVTGDDSSQIDNDASTTTSGTRVESCASTERIATTVTEFMIWCAEYCHQNLAKDVELIYVPGNHDSLLGFMCAMVVKAYFHSHSDIVCDCERNPRKARLFKKVLVAFDHGDWVPPARMSSILPNLWPEYYAASKYRVVHSGHFHKTKLVKPLMEFSDGVLVRTSPSLAPMDTFHNNRAFLGEEAAEAFVYNDIGLVASLVVRARE